MGMKTEKAGLECHPMDGELAGGRIPVTPQFSQGKKVVDNFYINK
jgi:hypothetical protein